MAEMNGEPVDHRFIDSKGDTCEEAQASEERWYYKSPPIEIIRTRYIKLDAFPDRHSHPGADEVYYVVRGEVRLELDGHEHALAPGDALTASRGVKHMIWPVRVDSETLTVKTVPLADLAISGADIQERFCQKDRPS